MTESPHLLFSQWFSAAQASEAITEPTAMTLATATAEGAPSARIVLLKEHSEAGFIFYTNYEGRKSGELAENPHAALCFYWMPLDKQIRIEGRVEKVPTEMSDAYFASRARKKQIGAWASAQSQVMESETALVERLEAYEQKFADTETIPRPPHWGGWCVIPQRYEFWQQKDFRLHDRWEYVRANEGDEWQKRWLFP